MENINLNTLSNEQIIKAIASLDGILDSLGEDKNEER